METTPRAASVACIATYPDGRSTLEVRIRVNAALLKRARAGNAKARASVCIQAKAAFLDKYPRWPGTWVDWDELQLDDDAEVPETATTTPRTPKATSPPRPPGPQPDTLF